MASTKAFLQVILAQCPPGDAVTYCAMMGEYILYYRGKVVGGIYDDRLLIKPTPSAVRLVPEGALVAPYAGAKELLWVREKAVLDDLPMLLEAMFDELPAPKPRKPKNSTSS